MMSESQWSVRTSGALFANFFQPDGSSRPGADWAVKLNQGANDYNVTVRAYLSDDATRRVRKDSCYQAQTVIGFIYDLLAQGWTPDQRRDLVIVIQNPNETKEGSRKRWWQFWS